MEITSKGFYDDSQFLRDARALAMAEILAESGKGNSNPVETVKEVIYKGTNTKITSARGNYFRDNRVRSALFKGMASDMVKGHGKFIKEYANFLENAYKKALRGQLKRSVRKREGKGVRVNHRQLGFATGNLRDSIVAKVDITLDSNANKGYLFIDFDISATHLEYGDYIANGRSAGAIPHTELIKWLKLKEKAGTLRLYIKKKAKYGAGVGDNEVKNMNENRENKIKRIANSISWAASIRPKPAVLKAWNDPYNNPELTEKFKKIVSSEGGKYRSKIRESVMRKIGNNDK